MLVYPTLLHHANTCHAQLEKDGVRIALTIDTPGAGDNIDNEFGFVVLSVLPDLVRILLSGSRKLLATFSVNTTTFWLKSLISSAILSSGTAECTLCFTSSHPLAIRRQYDNILAEESRIKRNPQFRDSRVHALLYFIPPTGHMSSIRRHFG